MRDFFTGKSREYLPFTTWAESVTLISFLSYRPSRIAIDPFYSFYLPRLQFTTNVEGGSWHVDGWQGSWHVDGGQHGWRDE